MACHSIKLTRSKTIQTWDADESIQVNCIAQRSRFFASIVSRLLFVVMTVLYIGAQVEQRKLRQLPDTTYLYKTKQVCGLQLPSDFADFTKNSIFEPLLTKDTSTSNFNVEAVITTNPSTVLPFQHQPQLNAKHGKEKEYAPLIIQNFETADDVRSTKGIIQHCGNCGQCSNPHDISIYDDTRNTLFHKTLKCSIQALTSSRQTVSDCMHANIGFTSGCNDCWVDNIMCTAQNCLFTCAWTALVSKIRVPGSTENDPQTLNACLQCDEKSCGPSFLQCAGANRRRAGITSDIQRGT